jgi:magnesium-transporting ATPase (P-type)
MAINYDVKRGDLIRINAAYKGRITAAKEAYKNKNGLKVARGFSKSPESRKIQSLKNRSLRRAERKKEAKGLAKATVNNRGTKANWNQVKLPTGTTIIPVNAGKPSPFFTELSLGDGTDQEVVSQWQNAQAAGYLVTGIVNNTFTRTVSYSYDLYTFKQRVRALYQLLKELQKTQNKSPKVSKTSISTQGGPPPPKKKKKKSYPRITTTIVANQAQKTLSIVVEAHE